MESDHCGSPNRESYLQRLCCYGGLRLRYHQRFFSLPKSIVKEERSARDAFYLLIIRRQKVLLTHAVPLLYSGKYLESRVFINIIKFFEISLSEIVLLVNQNVFQLFWILEVVCATIQKKETIGVRTTISTYFNVNQLKIQPPPSAGGVGSHGHEVYIIILITRQ